MTQKGPAGQVIEAVADATGRSDDEVRLALTLAAVASALLAALRVVDFLDRLGASLFGRAPH